MFLIFSFLHFRRDKPSKRDGKDRDNHLIEKDYFLNITELKSDEFEIGEQISFD
jgi:hypothetical protein